MSQTEVLFGQLNPSLDVALGIIFILLTFLSFALNPLVFHLYLRKQPHTSCTLLHMGLCFWNFLINLTRPVVVGASFLSPASLNETAAPIWQTVLTSWVVIPQNMSCVIYALLSIDLLLKVVRPFYKIHKHHLQLYHWGVCMVQSVALATVYFLEQGDVNWIMAMGHVYPQLAAREKLSRLLLIATLFGIGFLHSVISFIVTIATAVSLATQTFLSPITSKSLQVKLVKLFILNFGSVTFSASFAFVIYSLAKVFSLNITNQDTRIAEVREMTFWGTLFVRTCTAAIDPLILVLFNRVLTKKTLRLLFFRKVNNVKRNDNNYTMNEVVPN
eukprot:sb/3466669/